MKLTGDRNQCPTCGDYFNSTAAFDKHRAGNFSVGRYCLPNWERWCKGMRQRPDGFWVGSEMPEREYAIAD